MTKDTKKHIYYVKGMHCASCEILIEKKLLTIKGVKFVEAKADEGKVLIEYVGERPKTEMLNSIFRKENYVFSDQPVAEDNSPQENNFFKILAISILLIVGFLYLNKLGLSGWVNVSSKSSLPAFFVLGLVAGLSSCAALVGGLILSMSKQWNEIYHNRESMLIKLQPHLMFHTGRIISYGVFGAMLGVIGGKLQITPGFTSFLIIAVSIVMFLVALQMLGVKGLNKFQFTLPKFVTRYIADETNFKGRYMPFIMGALTFFLPCGFTTTAQGLALLSGNPIQSGFIMSFFALGTTFPLLFIGLSAVKFSSQPYLAYQFSKIVGILILFFALFNINSQLNVLGYFSFSDFFSKSPVGIKNSEISDKGLAPIVDGKQILKMEASAFGYEPNYFKVRVGVPVRWEITDRGTNGCTNAILARGLFDEEINLTPGQTIIKEFTPQKPGRYKFSCWMGMVSGIIEVIDETSAATQSDISNSNGNLFVQSGIESFDGSCSINGGCSCSRR